VRDASSAVLLSACGPSISLSIITPFSLKVLLDALVDSLGCERSLGICGLLLRRESTLRLCLADIGRLVSGQ
jgi:ABC-type thiamin/hydroxymethylpyrimidine transport system permease subunit